jgi:hypothetical protein
MLLTKKNKAVGNRMELQRAAQAQKLEHDYGAKRSEGSTFHGFYAVVEILWWYQHIIIFLPSTKTVRIVQRLHTHTHTHRAGKGWESPPTSRGGAVIVMGAVQFGCSPSLCLLLATQDFSETSTKFPTTQTS